jgi:hypothetical protein
MKYKTLLLSPVLSTLLFGACKKETAATIPVTEYHPPYGKMISTVTIYVNGLISATEYYFYENNRPLKYTIKSGSDSKYTETYSYETGRITLHRYENNSLLPSFYYFITDSLTTSYMQPNIRSDKRKYDELNRIKQLTNSTFSNHKSDSTYYYYDASGNCTHSISRIDSNYYTANYYTYCDTPNSISVNNKGVYWTGLQNKNLLRSDISVTSYSGYMDSMFNNYEYELFADGTVKIQINHQVHSGITTNFVYFYTYNQ